MLIDEASDFMMCREFVFVPICDTCLTKPSLSQAKKTTNIHHCGKTIHQKHLSSCKSNKIKPLELELTVEQSFKETFNQKKVMRLDSDVANKTKAEEMLFQFKEKEYDVLIGTQLIAKGHDFDVSLSAVMLAELGLKLPSYLANERTYNLLKQMIGRSGRYQDGLSLIQTYSPNHFVFESLSESYEVFYTQELENRRLGHFPPFTNMVQIRFGHKNEDELDETLNRIKRDIIKTHSQYTVLGPSDSFIHYANGLFYSNLTIKAPSVRFNASIKNLKQNINTYLLTSILTRISYRGGNAMNIVFMGTPSYAVPSLAYLHETYGVKLVVTQPDKKIGRKGEIEHSPVKKYALEHNILVFQPIKMRKDYQTILDVKPDLIITAAYGQMIPMILLDSGISLNLHGSLLLKYRGVAPVQIPSKTEITVTGVTLMYMAQKMDAGDILLKRNGNYPERYYETLLNKISMACKKLLEETSSVIKGKIIVLSK